MEDAPWVRAEGDGFRVQWHMPAGESHVGILTACDRPFADGSQIEERPVRVIQLNERCPVCQDVYSARQATEPA